MRVIRAEVMGMCFGVRDALVVIDGIEKSSGTAIYGQLVHNEVVLEDLRTRGFSMHSESERLAGGLPDADRVVITAHGISDRQKRRLEESGKTLVDTTCPLVLRAPQAAQRLQSHGYHVLLIGRKGHVEVQGIVEDLSSFDVLETEADVRAFPYTRLGLVCQTTATDRRVKAIREAVVASNP